MTPTPTPTPRPAHLDLAVVGAGPVGLGLALHAARRLPEARITLYDARPLDADVSRDPRVLALSLGSVQWLERLGAWDADAAQPISAVHVSQAPPSGLPFALPLPLPLPGTGEGSEPSLCIRADEEGVPMLGAVLSYGKIVAPLQAAWLAAVEREPQRLVSRFGMPVAGLKNVADGVEVDAGICERHALAVVAEGGVYAGATHRALAAAKRPAVTRDYAQTAWVGQLAVEGGDAGTAFERFTRHGPVALLPLKPYEDAPAYAAGPAAAAAGRHGATADPHAAGAAAPRRAALVWCVASNDDPVAELDGTQRIAVLNTLLPRAAGRIVGITHLKRFPLGLSAERTLVDGRSVRIGNAAQTLHPVAGQGLNLGLRDAHALVDALSRLRGGDLDALLRRVDWQRAPDRWAMIAATDFLARSFTWKLPGLGLARGAGLAALQALGPARSLLARQMMFGRR